MNQDTPREKLLLQMYDQMFNDINTHIMVVWQSVGVVVGAFAVLALVEKAIISIDVGASLIVLLCGWLFANLFDAAYWYNRNLVIIANIEREFLQKSDAHDIHYYFTAHRPRNKMITHLRIQFALGVAITVLITAFHFIREVIPGFSLPFAFANIDWQKTLPYVFGVGVVAYARHVKLHRAKSYAELIANSPGKAVDTTGIVFGVGHGFRSEELVSPLQASSRQSGDGDSKDGSSTPTRG